MVNINFFSDIGAIKFPVQKIVAVFNKIIKVKEKLFVNVILISPNKIRKINNNYRKKNKITDVLSFRYHREIGEIYICYAQAKKQAKENGLSTQQELTTLLIHGLLHVAGYHHEKSERQAKRMFTKQQKIVSLCR